MRSPQPQDALRNSETPSPRPGIQSHHHPHFHSTVSVQKLRRLNTLIFVFRLAAFCFSVAASVFMLVNPRSASNSPRWYNFDAFRFVLAANAIVAVYSLFEMGASVWEISSGVTLLPEILQVWFDFGHDQVHSLYLYIYIYIYMYIYICVIGIICIEAFNLASFGSGLGF
ncbi:hypothetical protein ACSBR1_027139 [Camellia fascicularis]